MKVPVATIPTQFVRQDTRTNDADQFANVAEQQRKRLNHNILLAQRIRKCLVTMGYGNDGLQLYATEPLTSGVATPLISVPLTFTPGVRELVVVLRAYRLSTGNVTLYAYTEAGNQEEDIDTSVSVTVSASSATRYAVTVPLSRKARQKGRGRLNVVADGFMEGADLVGPNTITEIGPNFLEGNVPGAIGFPTGALHRMAYIPTNTSIAPRRVVHWVQNVDAAGNSRLYVQPGWDRLPDIGADTFALKAAAGVQVDSVSVYEERVSSFYDETSTMRV